MRRIPIKHLAIKLDAQPLPDWMWEWLYERGATFTPRLKELVRDLNALKNNGAGVNLWDSDVHFEGDGVHVTICGGHDASGYGWTWAKMLKKTFSQVYCFDSCGSDTTFSMDIVRLLHHYGYVVVNDATKLIIGYEEYGPQPSY